MSRLLAVFVAMALIVGTMIYLLILVPTLGTMEDVFVGFDSIGETEETQLDRIMLVSTRIVPLMFALGALLFLFAAVSRRQSHRGRM